MKALRNALIIPTCFAAAAAAAAAVVCGLPVATIRRFVKSTPATADDLPVARKLARWLTPVYTLLRRKPSCFEKALALSLALRWAGVGSDVVLGANRDCGDFRAHAWVSVGGVEFFRDSDREYLPLTSL